MPDRNNNYNRRLRRLLVTLAVIGMLVPTITAVGAETLLSLDQAIEIALEQGYDMKSHRLSLIQAEQNRLAAKYRFRTNVDMSLSAPSWSEQMTKIEVADDLPVYNSLGTFRYQGSLNINQPLPTDGQLSLRSQMYQSKESNYFADTDITKKRKDFYTNISLYFEQPLFTYNRIRTNLRRAELNYERSSLSLKRNQLDVVYNVTRGFFNLYRATRSCDIAQETFDQQENQYNTAKSKFDAGLIPEVEALRLEVDLANASSDLFEAESELERQKEEFKKLIGVDLNEDIGVETQIETPSFIVDRDKALTFGLQNRTELRENEIDVELSKISLTETDARSEVSANVSAYYSFTGRSDPGLAYSTGVGDLFDSSWEDLQDRPANRGVTFTVDIPVWDWGVNKAEVQSAQASLRRAELQLTEERKTIVNSISDAVRQVETAERRLEVLKKSQDVAQRTYDISLERFNNGAITSLDLAQDNKSLSNAKLQYLSAYISYKLAVADLKRKTFYDFEKDRPLLDD